MTLGLVDAIHITTTLLFSSVTVHPVIGGGGGGISINIMHTHNSNSESVSHDIPTPSISILSEIAGDVCRPNSSIPLLLMS